MQPTRLFFFLGYLFVLLIAGPAQAQLGFDLTIKKPEPYQERELKAEKTGDKKLKFPKKLFQNATTHYNYFFNANNKLNEIIDRAKAVHKDDYTRLLSFYNYSAEATLKDSSLLDSVIYKSKTGIVLHDLRNEWIDNLYLLWGSAYYLKQEYDSAYQMFQFINYAFAEKEKDGYYRYIGSRMDGSETISVSTKENNNLAKRIFSEPPARNDAFIWQVRTMIRQGAYPEAGSLIATLKNDPNFPKRLNGALEEVQALWFYQQQIWDSSAYHLVKALNEARNGQERARWEFLAGQMFERKGLYDQAKTYYTKSISESTDPVMEVYARLNLIRINKTGTDNIIDRNLADLARMARKDKYENYRDVIYSMAARMELERGNFAAAREYLAKSAKYKSDNQTANNDAYLQLGDLAFEKQQYRQSSEFYDSVKTTDLAEADAARVIQRKILLTSLLHYTDIVDRQDSLQRIAAMPEEERTAFIKKLVKQLRRAQGLKDESAGTAVAVNTDPFSADQNKGEWYFYNDNLKKKGQATFAQFWGSRPNVDNWRRQSDVTSQLRNRVPEKIGTVATSGSNPEEPPTYDVLLAGLPFTQEQIKASNDSIQLALYELGKLYMNDVEDFPSAITSFESIRSRFANPDSLSSILFDLYYSYNKNGNTAKAAEMKKLLLNLFPSSRYASILNTGIDPLSTTPAPSVTKAYEKVYDLYLEGNFSDAEAGKKLADSIYHTNYWSPQLLYIEAVYQIRNQQDSIAKKTLSTLISQNAGTPLAAKAKNLLMVLSRRAQIEEELRNLKVERPKEDSLYVEPMPVAAQVEKKQEISAKPKDTVIIKKQPPAKQVIDTVAKKQLPATVSSPFVYDAKASYYTMVILNKVDVVYANETRNAFQKYNRENFPDKTLDAKVVPLNADTRLLLISNFNSAADAVEYVQKVKPVAASVILPWLKSDKFSFSIITEQNLQTVLNAKELSAYQKFLEQSLPVKL